MKIKSELINSIESEEVRNKLESILEDENFGEWSTEAKLIFIKGVITDCCNQRNIDTLKYNNFEEAVYDIIEPYYIRNEDTIDSNKKEKSKKEILIQEKEHLDIKIREVQLELEGVTRFETPYFVTVSNLEMDLKIQFKAMMKYSQILQKRINRL